LGIEVGDSIKKVAVVFCGGDHNQEKVQTLYNGVSDCISASLIAGGPKGCAYGCLGMGSCARACPFNAIEMVNGLAVVHPELCVGCGACVSTCPRNIIGLAPQDAKVHIYCSSPEKGAVKMKVCAVPCIACRKCVKAGEEDQFTVDGFKVSVNYNAKKLVDSSIFETVKCPTGCLLSGDEHIKIEEAKNSEVA
jgi:electron transport complex protein RnfB